MIGIITAVTNERDAILRKMKEIESLIIFDIEFYRGVIGKTPCVTAMSGVGKVNAARCTQLMIDRFNPARIVNVGSAGALHPDLNIGDVIISTLSIQHDVDLTVFGIKKGAFDEGESGFVETDKEFAALCQDVMEKNAAGLYAIHSGPIVTGDQFNDSLEKKAQLYEEFGAYCIEMEGAAVAQVCAMCGVPFVIIRSISDKPDNDTRMMYENFKVLAAERCAEFLGDLIDVLEKKNETIVNGGDKQ